MKMDSLSNCLRSSTCNGTRDIPSTRRIHYQRLSSTLLDDAQMISLDEAFDTK